jgi:hypothetical protein
VAAEKPTKPEWPTRVAGLVRQHLVSLLLLEMPALALRLIFWAGVLRVAVHALVGSGSVEHAGLRISPFVWVSGVLLSGVAPAVRVLGTGTVMGISPAVICRERSRVFLSAWGMEALWLGSGVLTVWALGSLGGLLWRFQEIPFGGRVTVAFGLVVLSIGFLWAGALWVALLYPGLINGKRLGSLSHLMPAWHHIRAIAGFGVGSVATQLVLQLGASSFLPSPSFELDSLAVLREKYDELMAVQDFHTAAWVVIAAGARMVRTTAYAAWAISR